MTEIRSHRAPKRPRLRTWRFVALLAGALAVVAVSVLPASAAMPKPGEGWISLQTRTCGDSSGWQASARANGSSAPRWILPLRNVKVTCPARHEPKSSRSTTRPAAWVKPGPGGCSSGYGKRTFYDSRLGRWRTDFHQGQDISTGYGARVVSAAAGKVTAAGWSGGAGRRVWVRVNGSTELVVMHLSRIVVHTGQTVKAGQLLGYSGSTGDSTSAHLHFAVRVNGKFTDPKKFMSARGVRLC